MYDLSEEQQIGIAERIADRDAESELVRLFSPRVFAMLCARTRDREASRDLLHDVLIGALGALRSGQLRDPAKLAGFIHGITRHVVQAHLRGQNTREEPLEEEPPAGMAADAVEDSERLGLVREALRELDGTDREILARTLIDGQKPGSIASALGLSSEVVRRQAIRSELSAMGGSRGGRRRAWAVWAAVAAMVAIAVGLGWWGLRPAAQAGPVVSRVPPAGGVGLDVLARVAPPAYTAPVLRGGTRAGGAFREAMGKYRRGLYAEAIPGLVEASRVDGGNADAQFFLGICYLMEGQTDAAISRLRATIALGDTLYLEMAHFYLAKALIRKNDVAGAEAELERAIALGGDREAESRELLEALRRAR